MLYRIKVEHLVNINSLSEIEGENNIFENAKIKGGLAYKICDINIVDDAEKEKFRNYLGYQVFRDHGIK